MRGAEAPLRRQEVCCRGATRPGPAVWHKSDEAKPVMAECAKRCKNMQKDAKRCKKSGPPGTQGTSHTGPERCAQRMPLPRSTAKVSRVGSFHAAPRQRQPWAWLPCRTKAIFFSPRLFPPAQVSRIPQKSHSSETGGELRARRPASVGKDVALGRRPARCRWAARERGLGRNREPLPPPARVRGRDRDGAGESPTTGELLQESLRLLSPEAATSRPPGKWRDACARSRSQARRQLRPGFLRRREGHSRQLPAGARQKRAPRESSRVGRNPGSRLIADPCRSALERASAPDQDPRGGTSSAVVTEPVKFPATTAQPRRQRQ